MSPSNTKVLLYTPDFPDYSNYYPLERYIVLEGLLPLFFWQNGTTYCKDPRKQTVTTHKLQTVFNFGNAHFSLSHTCTNT